MKRYLMLALAGCLLAACSREELAEPGPAGEIRFEIGFAPLPDKAAVQADAATRVATDNLLKSTWEEGDAIGLFAVEHGSAPAAAGNPLHNVKLTYTNGKWTTDAPLYWPLGAAQLDFYAYHPYDATVSDPAKIAFSAADDQSAVTDGKSAFNRSDLLWAAAGNDGAGIGKGELVPLAFSHALALVEVTVRKSMLGDYAPETLGVWLDGCRTSLVLDLTDGTVSGQSASPSQIKMYPCPTDAGEGIYSYRALVVPGEVSAQTFLLRFEYDGRELLASRPLTEAVTLTAGRAETFGIAFPFTSVTVSPWVRISDLLTEEEYPLVTHLKVIGRLNKKDMAIIRDKMTSLVSLDLGSATMEGNLFYYRSLYNKKGLKEFVFPTVAKIDEQAFLRCSDLTGSLTIPDCVVEIGPFAFSECSAMTGTLTLPKNLTTIPDYTFSLSSGLSGSLKIPAKVTRLGVGAFKECSGFDGTLHLPEGLDTIDMFCFYRCSGFTGDLTLPSTVTTLGEYAFAECGGFDGTLTLPAGLKTISNSAFGECSRLSSIICHMPDPTKLAYGTAPFREVNESIPVYVPASAIALYRTTWPWLWFDDIRPIPES